jgi:hypothetical protein
MHSQASVSTLRSLFFFQVTQEGGHSKALLVYEILITFGREVEAIWRRKLGPITILYFFVSFPACIPWIATHIVPN